MTGAPPRRSWLGEWAAFALSAVLRNAPAGSLRALADDAAHAAHDMAADDGPRLTGSQRQVAREVLAEWRRDGRARRFLRDARTVDIGGGWEVVLDDDASEDDWLRAAWHGRRHRWGKVDPPPREPRLTPALRRRSPPVAVAA